MEEISELTVLVDRLRRDRRRDPRSGRRDYSLTAGELADRCERLLAAGEAATLVAVLRKAVDRMTAALMYMDDSSGIVGDDLAVVMRLYARACTAAPPNPQALAAWLVKLECDGPGWPRIKLREFTAALGDSGLAHLRALVEQRAAVADPDSWTGTFAVRDLREQLAEVSGDVDRYVAVLSEHLVSAAQYLRIVTALRDAGRAHDAIGWARRGLTDFDGGGQADRLRDALVTLLLDSDEPAAALAERRSAFERHPTGAAYRALLETAERAGSETDPGGWAIDVLRERTARQPAYASELLEVLLAENRDDDAWTLGLEHPDRLYDRQLLALLERRRVTHPRDVIDPYQRLIDRHILNAADKHRYRRAIDLLPALRDAYRGAGDPDDFPQYLSELRAQNKRRPAFLAKLDIVSM